MRDDHETIRAHAAALAGGDHRADVVAAARALGERLAAHVRFEERVLFELLERRLSAADLARLGAAVADAERQT